MTCGDAGTAVKSGFAVAGLGFGAISVGVWRAEASGVVCCSAVVFATWLGAAIGPSGWGEDVGCDACCSGVFTTRADAWMGVSGWAEAVTWPVELTTAAIGEALDATYIAAPSPNVGRSSKSTIPNPINTLTSRVAIHIAKLNFDR